MPLFGIVSISKTPSSQTIKINIPKSSSDGAPTTAKARPKTGGGGLGSGGLPPPPGGIKLPPPSAAAAAPSSANLG